jgi:hypothetical protein
MMFHDTRDSLLRYGSLNQPNVPSVTGIDAGFQVPPLAARIAIGTHTAHAITEMQAMTFHALR